MNVAVDVNATFNTTGEIKPLYIRLENYNHELETYKILRVTNKKSEKYSGINSFLFNCIIQIDGVEKEINIRYYLDSHKWTLIN